MQFIQTLVASLSELGARRLLLLAVTGLSITALVLFSTWQLQKPVRGILYSSLDKADVIAIGAALSEVGIPFDVNEAGDAVLVDFGKSAEARMLLAERGLPKSDKSGYELFDQMGSLGLTSFMQQVTKVRALEGELIRTIQQLDGVKAARVHLALKSEGTLRSKDAKPSASVMIRIEGSPREGLAGTIRHIVAAAIPGLVPEQVMVSTTEGTLLAGPRNGEDEGSNELLELERKLSSEMAKRVSNTLEPFAGAANIRVSVSTAINLDKRQINETNYDPNSKVERSSFITKSVDNLSDAGGGGPVSVDQNIPQEVRPQAATAASSKKKEDRQETVNYEVDTRQTAITSAGYVVNRMSIAVVVNKKALLATLSTGADEKSIAARLKEMEDIVRSSAGLQKERGDDVKVSLIEFYESGELTEAVATPTFMDHVAGNLGTIINAVSLLLAMIVILLVGLRPALKILVSRERDDVPALPAAEQVQAAPTEATAMGQAHLTIEPESVSMPGMNSREQLNRLVNVDVDRAAQVLKKWLNDPEQTAA